MAPSRGRDNLTTDAFLKELQAHAATFEQAVATKAGEWIVKGFIDVYRNIYSISVDTKIVSKVLELLLFPLLVDFSERHGLRIELSRAQNHYPDATFLDTASGAKFAVDIKSTYRTGDDEVNGMTLGAFTGYFRDRTSAKNILYPYGAYAGHFVLGVVYSQCDDVADERRRFSIDQLDTIPAVIRDFRFFVQPKWRIAADRPGSGNTKNIGSATRIEALVEGTGPFAARGETVYDDYWMNYLTLDMARQVGLKKPPYNNLKTYDAYWARRTRALGASSKTKRWSGK